MTEEIEGYVEKIVFRNEENGYTVLNLVTDEDEYVCVGTFTFMNEGERVLVSGIRSSHPIYGEQFQVQSYEIKEPEDVMAMERYLGSGSIKGIGVAMAARIVKRFRENTFRIIEEEPERLAEVKGISERIAREIGEQFAQKKELRGAMIFLQQYGISLNLAVKIYKQYGNRLYDVIRENPYRLAEDISGIGFKQADEIAMKVGIRSDSSDRIKAGILYILLQGNLNGHTFLPETILRQSVMDLLLIDSVALDQQLMSLQIDRRIVVKESSHGKLVYASSFYYMELNVARMLCDLDIHYSYPQKEVEQQIEKMQQQSELILEQMQRKAVMEAMQNGLLIITGGPGTGKTTTINAIIKIFEAAGMDMLLAAPTGRAAKRMTEATGVEAQTIHRLLEVVGSGEQDNNRNSFGRNEQNPLETDVIIIDEMSMVDIQLMHALLKAITVGTRLILVGDVNQLPSVGPGNVLRDMIDSGQFGVVALTKIFRQASESDIIMNAHKINAGEPIVLNNKSKDFFLLKRDDVTMIVRVMISLIQEKLPKYVDASWKDIQVLTPMRKGELGVERLNQVLQRYLNPPSPDKKEKQIGDITFREGDKVMQIKNNYNIAWEMRSKYNVVYETGTGVYNGDVGFISEINLFGEFLVVIYDETKRVEYPFSALDELELAYAITIHKSQGSEYPAVIIPLLTGPRMLFNRNLLYTAVTRAKKCVTLVGSEYTVQSMIDNQNEQKRYSTLRERIQEAVQGI